ncbi:MAG: riboflavin kinase [Patescibacteria group bacterium]|jgi:riboflavin kinase/FMN adenylyltransferase
MKTIKIKGKVVKGKGKGKAFGFPTANIALPELEEKIGSGVYYGRVAIGSKEYKAAIFIPKAKDLLEANIFDFDGDIYGSEIEVILGKKLREAIDFNSEKDLIDQVKKDLGAIKMD